LYDIFYNIICVHSVKILTQPYYKVNAMSLCIVALFYRWCYNNAFNFVVLDSGDGGRVRFSVGHWFCHVRAPEIQKRMMHIARVWIYWLTRREHFICGGWKLTIHRGVVTLKLYWCGHVYSAHCHSHPKPALNV